LFYKFSYRYLVSKKSTNAINIIAWVSIAAITLVTAAMIIVMSVFNGLSHLVKGLYNGFYSDLKIVAQSGKVITLTPEQLLQIKNTVGVAYVSCIAEEKALVKIGENQTVVSIKGVDDNYTKVSKLESYIRRGEYALGTPDNANIILGYGVENALGIFSTQALQKITAYVPNRNQRFTGKMDDFNTGEVAPNATFAIQQDFDNKYAISNIGFVKTLIGLDSNQYTSIEIALQNEQTIESTKQLLQKNIDTAMLVQTKYEQNQSMYNVMKYEKWGVYGIFCLVLLISSFTIVGALTMLVLEKKKDIGILKSMGASNRFVEKIFLTEGVLLGVIGVGLGCVLGISVCALQHYFHIIKLNGGSFLVDYYPVKMMPFDILLIVITVLSITFIAGYFPAQKAAKQALLLKS
jgi:lipoprotein-releasing system permease protein